MRAPAKRYVNSLGHFLSLESLPRRDPPLTEAEAVAWLIEVHKRYRHERQPETAATWFGRLLWGLFGRWL